MELLNELLDEANEKILSKLDNTLGVSKNKDVLRNIIKENRNSKNFGNARFVRNVYEKTIIKHATNTKSKKRKSILSTITKEDISYDNVGVL